MTPIQREHLIFQIGRLRISYPLPKSKVERVSLGVLATGALLMITQWPVTITANYFGLEEAAVFSARIANFGVYVMIAGFGLLSGSALQKLVNQKQPS